MQLRPELEDPLGLVEAAQPVLAEVTHVGVRGERRPRGRRDQHLAAVAGRADPSGTVHVDSDVAAVDAHRLAGMDAHPDAQRVVMSRLDRERRGYRAFRSAKAEGEFVPAAVDLLTRLRLRGVADDLPVPGEGGRIGVAQLLDEARRALDVREQEGDAQGRESTPPAYA